MAHGTGYLFEANWQLPQPVMAAAASDLGVRALWLGPVFPKFGGSLELCPASGLAVGHAGIHRHQRSNPPDADQDAYPALTKIHTLLGRRGVVVSYRTLNRYATRELGLGQRKMTVRVADCGPGAEVQVDFGRLGLLTDASDGRRGVVQGLIFTAVYSRHRVVWPTYRKTINDVIAGFEAVY